jgi:hypothetical protein
LEHTCSVWIVLVTSLLRSPSRLSRILAVTILVLRVLTLLLLILLLVTTTSSDSCRGLTRLVKVGSQLTGLLCADSAQPLACLAQGQHAGTHHLQHHHTSRFASVQPCMQCYAFTSQRMGLRMLVPGCLGC